MFNFLLVGMFVIFALGLLFSVCMVLMALILVTEENAKAQGARQSHR